jgi:hypothetical protein
MFLPRRCKMCSLLWHSETGVTSLASQGKFDILIGQGVYLTMCMCTGVHM